MFGFLKYRSCEEGAVAAEAVFVFPLLIFFGFGAVDTSLLMLQNHKMESGLTAAGNYLSRTSIPSTHEAAAKRLATTGQLSPGGAARIPNWVESDVQIIYQNTNNPDDADGRDYRGGDTIQVVRLSSQFNYDGFGFLKAVTGGTITVNADYEERLVGS